MLRFLILIVLVKICLNINMEFLFKFQEVSEFLDAFRENSTMQRAIEKVDKMANLVTRLFRISFFEKMGLQGILCKIYSFQTVLRTENPTVYAILKSVLRLAGALEKPINISFLQQRSFGYFRDSSALLRLSDTAFNEIFMRNMVLKFDNPLKTGL